MLSEDIVKKLLDESEIEYMDFPDGNSAFGIYIENAVFVFHDAQMCVKSYPDTGVFLLLKGSYTASSDNKYQEYIFEGKTIKSIVFQSRNAAAQFVLGDTGQKMLENCPLKNVMRIIKQRKHLLQIMYKPKF